MSDETMFNLTIFPAHGQKPQIFPLLSYQKNEVMEDWYNQDVGTIEFRGSNGALVSFNKVNLLAVGYTEVK